MRIQTRFERSRPLQWALGSNRDHRLSRNGAGQHNRSVSSLPKPDSPCIRYYSWVCEPIL